MTLRGGLVIGLLQESLAARHEEGADKGGDDRQDEVSDFLGGDIFEDSHRF